MPISNQLLDILVCPETKLAVALAPAELVAQLNEQIKSGQLKNHSGKQVAAEMDQALLRTDGKRLYPVYRDIPVMLAEDGIDL